MTVGVMVVEIDEDTVVASCRLWPDDTTGGGDDDVIEITVVVVVVVIVADVNVVVAAEDVNDLVRELVVVVVETEMLVTAVVITPLLDDTEGDFDFLGELLLFTLEVDELAMPVIYPDDELTEEPGEGTSSSSSLLFSDGDLTNSVESARSDSRSRSSYIPSSSM